ncbi:hypothetical protein MRX96_013418 [Rhipicephalus microplus]
MGLRSRAGCEFGARGPDPGLAGKLTHLWPRPGQGGPGSQRRRSGAIAGTGFTPTTPHPDSSVAMVTPAGGAQKLRRRRRLSRGLTREQLSPLAPASGVERADASAAATTFFEGECLRRPAVSFPPSVFGF